MRVLLVDDDEDDYLITRDLLAEVEGQEYELEWVSSYEVALKSIACNKHDVYFLDYRLGGRNGLELLKEAAIVGCKGPMILLTGQGDRDVDVEATRAGALDYLVKGRIDADVLERSIRYAIERNRVERRLENIVIELEEALTKVKTLSGLLPMCSSCKRIRDDWGYWNQLESYVSNHSEAELSHSICPECYRQLYPEQYLKSLKKDAK